MENLILNSTINTPEIILDINMKNLSISGNILPENPLDFFMILDNYIDIYIQNNQNNQNNDLTIIFDITYMNSSSSKRLYQFIKKCIEIFKNLNIKWIYELNDDDGKEYGLNFESTLGFKFDFQIKQ